MVFFLQTRLRSIFAKKKKNKDNYLACGDCLTLTKIIGGFNFNEYNDFEHDMNLSIEKLNLKHKEIQTKLEEMILLKSKIDNLKNQISTLNNDINSKQNSITKNDSPDFTLYTLS